MYQRINLANDEYFHPYKFKIYPNEMQKNLIDDFINQYRFVYNWGIQKEREQYQDFIDGKSEYGFIFYMQLRELFHEYKKSLSWFTLPNETTRNALKKVEQSYKFFFNKITKKPKFKSKKHSTMSFHTRSDRFHIQDDYITFETYNGFGRNAKKISLGFNSGFNKDTKYYNPTISKDTNGDYYVSFTVIDKKKPIKIIHDQAIGVDLGIRNTFTTSQLIDDDNYHHQPWKTINRYSNRIKNLDKKIANNKIIKARKAQSLSDKTSTIIKASDIHKSKRELKREDYRRKAYKKIHNIKNTYYHTMAKKIVTSGYSAIGIEDLRNITHNIPWYIKRYTSKVSFYTIRKYIEDKSNIYNVPLFIADNQYPSSQICSCCGHKQQIKVGVKTYKCPACGNIIDRDLNAAINLQNEAYNYYYRISCFE